MKKELLITLEEFEESEKYWLEKLAGEISDTRMPGDYPGAGGYERADYRIEFNKVVTEKLFKVSKNNDLSIYIVLLTGYKILISRYTGLTDVVLLSPVYTSSNREYNKFVALRDRVLPDITFKELLMSVRQTVLEGYKNEHYPMEKLVEYLEIDESLFSRNAMFYDRIHRECSLNDITDDFFFDMVITLSKNNTHCTGDIVYNARLFKKKTIKRLFEYYQRILSQVLHETGLKISEIELCTEEEKNNILFQFNNTAKDYPGEKTLQEWFEELAARQPGEIAVRSTIDSPNIYDELKTKAMDIQIDYEDLNIRADQLACELGKNGVTADSIVCIMVRHPLEMVVSIVGVLKAGGAYLPLEPGYPGKMIEYILNDSKPRALVSEQTLLERLPEGVSSLPVILVDDDSLIEHTPSKPPINKRSNLAYVIYTSGTTGKPKGTLVEHRGVVNYTCWRIRAYHYSEKDITLQMLSYCFDGFCSNFYSSLLSGGTLVIVPESMRLDYEYIKETIKNKKVTNTGVVPDMYETLLDCCSTGDLESLRFVVLAGDKSRPGLIQKSKKKIPHVQLINEYGPTEATVTAAAHLEMEEFNTTVIGKPISNTRLYIFDRFFQPAPFNVPGELFIAGPGVARGYLNNPELTAEKFIDYRSYRSYSLYFSKKIYKTGDLARWLADGNIEFLSRKDQQVKIRGTRIELEEIENKLLIHEGIKKAAVTAKEDENGNKFLCAYYVEDPGRQTKLEVNQLREYLLACLPDYMIPSRFVSLESMPLTPTGKLDKKALPSPEVKSDEKYEAPGDEIERKLVEIWAEILGVEKHIIGLDSNFFELGGHSLKAISVISLIHKELNVKLPLAEVFEVPTIRNSSRYIKQSRQAEYASIPPAAPKTYYALSGAQKRLYILQQMNTKTTAYNVPGVFVMEEKPDNELLETAFKRLIQRHEVLRTSFQMVDDEPIYKIHDHVVFNLEYYNGSFQDPKNEGRVSGSSVDEIIGNFVKPFDLANAPLMRAGLLRTGDQEDNFILMVDLHHIIADAVSKDILRKDFMALYHGEELPPLKLQYKDYSEWWNSEAQQKARTQQEEYWLKVFEGEIPVLTIPIDYERPEVQTFEGSNLRGEIPLEDASLLKQIAVDEGATMYMVLLAVYNVLLSKISGLEDIIVGTGTAGRRHADLENIIGMFVNTLAIRNSPTKEKSFVEFLSEVRKRTIEAFENQDYPFDELVEKVKVVKDTSRHPLFNVGFALNTMNENENTEKTGKETVNKPPQVHYSYENKTSKFELILMFVEQGDHLYFNFEHNTKLFKRETIQHIAGNLKEILAAVVSDKNIRLKDIKISHEFLASKPGKARVEFKF